MRHSDLPALGEPFAGGFFAGCYYLNGEERALVLADCSHDVLAKLWDIEGPRHHAQGAESHMDGMANTKALAEAGSSIARNTLRMRIGGYSDWHIPARDQLVAIQIGLLSLPAFDRCSAQSMSTWGNGGGHGQYWSSTMKRAGSAWYSHMLPWCSPDTNWASRVMGIRPVRSIPIIREPNAKALPAEERIVARAPLPRHSAAHLERILERFINEDSGRFYGRTEDLVAALSCATN